MSSAIAEPTRISSWEKGSSGSRARPGASARARPDETACAATLNTQFQPFHAAQHTLWRRSGAAKRSRSRRGAQITFRLSARAPTNERWRLLGRRAGRAGRCATQSACTAEGCDPGALATAALPSAPPPPQRSHIARPSVPTTLESGRLAGRRLRRLLAVHQAGARARRGAARGARGDARARARARPRGGGGGRRRARGAAARPAGRRARAREQGLGTPPLYCLAPLYPLCCTLVTL
jgi:hypothetical protein